MDRGIQHWWSCHAKKVGMANALPSTLYLSEVRLPERYGPGRSIAFFGDSIVETLGGTAICRPAPRCRGIPAVFEEHFARHFRSATPLGIAMDHTQHLLYRLEHGELSAAMSTDPLLTSIVLIGTNNLGKGHTPQQV